MFCRKHQQALALELVLVKLLLEIGKLGTPIVVPAEIMRMKVLLIKQRIASLDQLQFKMRMGKL